jgi:hypothetical protein
VTAEKAWRVPRDWPGETAFILAGGPSVAGLDLAQLGGRRVIAINSSVFAWPAADVLIFGDTRWWRQHEAGLANFAGRIVTTALGARSPRLSKLRKLAPKPGAALSRDAGALCMQFTTLHAAIDLAAQLGAVRIVLLGADMQRAADGRSHHHPPHQWAVKPGCWDEQMAQLQWTAAELVERGIAVINCSPQSRIGWWRKETLNEVLRWGW